MAEAWFRTSAKVGGMQKEQGSSTASKKKKSAAKLQLEVRTMKDWFTKLEAPSENSPQKGSEATMATPVKRASQTECIDPEEVSNKQSDIPAPGNKRLKTIDQSKFYGQNHNPNQVFVNDSRQAQTNGRDGSSTGRSSHGSTGKTSPPSAAVSGWATKRKETEASSIFSSLNHSSGLLWDEDDAEEQRSGSQQDVDGQGDAHSVWKNLHNKVLSLANFFVNTSQGVMHERTTSARSRESISCGEYSG
jgi:hypothetical protein